MPIKIEMLFFIVCFTKRCTFAAPEAIKASPLSHGVMVAQQILVLFVKVRILVRQRKKGYKCPLFLLCSGLCGRLEKCLSPEYIPNISVYIRNIYTHIYNCYGSRIILSKII